MTDMAGSEAGKWRIDDLRALYINCTLKRSTERSRSIMEQHGVAPLGLSGRHGSSG